MTIQIDVFHHFPDQLGHDDRVHQRLTHIERMLASVLNNQSREEYQMARDFDTVLTQVAAEESAIDSILTLEQGLADKLRQMADDPKPEELRALADRLSSKTSGILASVAANTGLLGTGTGAGEGGSGVDTTGTSTGSTGTTGTSTDTGNSGSTGTGTDTTGTVGGSTTGTETTQPVTSDETAVDQTTPPANTGQL